MRRNRPTSLIARILAIALLAPSLLQVPLPQADFHVVRHRHAVGQVCPQHDHLLRWHPQAGEGDAVAVLHWHWLPPRSLDTSAADQAGRTLPAFHADDGDLNRAGQAPTPLIVAEYRVRDLRLDLNDEIVATPYMAVWVDLDARSDPPLRWSLCAPNDGLSSVGTLARLARWNC
ncbi:hypothetical protein [Paludisphaera rhizosphaerae]|uniref:hypothetical protein n=1 Tax=Paludisphaera rhizosphaerae TaxID=2711216 RepID=UPI0013E9DF67|nr:hypothetical protein [Paludisphaera rhizosphaerae]